MRTTPVWLAAAARRMLTFAFFAWLLATGFTASAQSAPNYTALWWNANESGWGLNVVHQGDILFVTKFTYQRAGLGTRNPPTWFFGSDVRKQPDGSYFGQWYQTVGSSFDANPFVPLFAAQVTSVGTIRLTFSGNSGTMTYTVNGATVTKAITKQVYGVAAASCSFTDNPDRSASTNYQDLWWNANESGWGVNFTHQHTQDRGEILFATMFNYQNAGQGAQNPPTWFFGSSLVKQPDGSFYGNLYQATGSAFDANPFVPLTTTNLTTVGTMRFTPINGQTGTLTYSVNGVTVVKTVTRQVYQYPVSSCTTVTTPALRYTDKVYATWTAASPYAVTKTGVTPVTNRTSYTAGNFPIFNCRIADKPLSDGKVLLDCQQRTTLKPRNFYIDPTTDTMYDYNGVVPADITFTFVQTNADKPEWSAKAKVSDGWYFTTFDVTWVLKFRYDSDGTVITVKAGTFATDGTINVLSSYSN